MTVLRWPMYRHSDRLSRKLRAGKEIARLFHFLLFCQQEHRFSPTKTIHDLHSPTTNPLQQVSVAPRIVLHKEHHFST